MEHLLGEMLWLRWAGRAGGRRDGAGERKEPPERDPRLRLSRRGQRVVGETHHIDELGDGQPEAHDHHV